MGNGLINTNDLAVDVNDNDYSWVDKLGVWPRRILLVSTFLSIVVVVVVAIKIRTMSFQRLWSGHVCWFAVRDPVSPCAIFEALRRHLPFMSWLVHHHHHHPPGPDWHVVTTVPFSPPFSQIWTTSLVTTLAYLQRARCGFSATLPSIGTNPGSTPKPSSLASCPASCGALPWVTMTLGHNNF